MDPITSEPQSLILSMRIYKGLLAVYPSEFRRAYGGPMLQVFRDCCRKAYSQSGLKGLIHLWALTLFDWLKTVIEEQLNRGTQMTRGKFIRLSGWGMVLAGVTLLLTFLPDADRILDGFYLTFGSPATPAQHNLYQTLSEGVRSLPIPLTILLITFGLLGLYIRYGEPAGQPAKIAIGVGIFSGAASLVSWFTVPRPTTNILIAFMFAGLFVFGLIALRVKPMQRGNGLPVLAGFWWPLLVILTYVFPQVLRFLGPQVPLWFSLTIFSIISICLALLGYLLQADILRVKETTPHQGIRL